MKRFKFIILFLVLLLTPAITLAESPLLQEKENTYGTIEDIQGNRLEGYLQLYPQDVTVSAEDNKEKSVPLSMIESIKVEKVQGGPPGANELDGESHYSVRMQNSQEIFTLQKKYAITLNTDVGVVTKNLDPEAIKYSSEKDSTLANKSGGDEPLIRDQSVILSLEIRF